MQTFIKNDLGVNFANDQPEAIYHPKNFFDQFII